MTVLGILHYLFISFLAAYMVYAAYWCFGSTRRGKRNMATVMERSEEIAAQAHADAGRVAALLTEIRDRLDRKAPADEPR
jgi:hypothetical protein